MWQFNPGLGKQVVHLIQKFFTFLPLIVLSAQVVPADSHAESTMDKISRTGVFAVGASQEDKPVGYIDEKDGWVGIGLDAAREIHEKLKKTLGKDIQLTLIPVNPRTRIPMLVDGQIDIVCDSATHTIRRNKVVDFSITWLASGTRLLTRKGSAVREAEDLAGKKTGAVEKSSAERIIRNLIDTGAIRPPTAVMVFPSHSQGFLSLQQGAIQAYCADEMVLAGLRAGAQEPSLWEVVGRLLSVDPYGFMLRENDSSFRDFVNSALIEMIRSGKYLQVYHRWYGPEGALPLPMNEETRVLLKLQSWPY